MNESKNWKHLSREARRERRNQFVEKILDKFDFESFCITICVVVGIVFASMLFMRMSDNSTEQNKSNYQKEQVIYQAKVEACKIAVNTDACLARIQE